MMRMTLSVLMIVAAGPMAAASPPNFGVPRFAPPPIVPRADSGDRPIDRPARLAVPIPQQGPQPVAFEPGFSPAPPRLPPIRLRTMSQRILLALPRPAKGPKPWSTEAKPRPRLASASFPLRHIDARQAAGLLRKHCANRPVPVATGCTDGQRPGISFTKSSIPAIIPDPNGRCVHVIADASQLEAIRSRIAEIDRRPQVYVFEIRVHEMHGKKRGTLISSPKIAVVAGRPGRFSIAGANGRRIEITAIVKSKRQADRPEVAPSAAVFQHRPHVVRVPVRTSAELLRDGAVIRASATAAAPAGEPAKTEGDRPQLRIYSVADLLKTQAGHAGLSPEALIAAAKLTVPASSRSGEDARPRIDFGLETRALIVRHSKAGHRRIAALLAALRAARDTER